jgi:hypothetical protein
MHFALLRRTFPPTGVLLSVNGIWTIYGVEWGIGMKKYLPSWLNKEIIIEGFACSFLIHVLCIVEEPRRDGLFDWDRVYAER